MSEPIILRLPTTSKSSSPSTNNNPPPNFQAPSPSQLHGVWHVSHSSLPLWKDKRNVHINYGELPPSGSLARMDDTVFYQTLTSDKVKTIHGIDTADASGHEAVWDWRGTGWLKVASSHWEVLGYGFYEGREWIVEYFASTLFTPAGVDILSKEKEVVPLGLVEGVKGALSGMEDVALRDLGEKLFEVKMD